MYRVPLIVQCIYRWSDEGGEDGDGKKRSEFHGGGERVEIAWASCMQMTWFYEVSRRRT